MLTKTHYLIHTNGSNSEVDPFRIQRLYSL